MEKKEIIQAVIMADNFSDCFKPFSSFDSPALLPLVNIPLISYVLEMINRNGVEEVWIVCSSFAERVREFVKKGIEEHLTWSVGMNVQIIGCEVRSLGDAMRELDGKGMLRGDFILMNFDTISNARLIPEIMRKHKENCKQDKETSMTVVYKKVMPGQRTGNEVVVVTNKQTNRLLFHQRVHSSIKEDKFKFPMDIFLDNQEVEIHHDLMDPQIAICSTTALPLFSDNFDYDTRDQFIRGIVMDQELQAASIYVAQLSNDQYAMKVSDWMAYDMASQDIINRWVYPLVPDMGVCSLRQQYLFLKNNIYRNNSVKIERNCVLKSDVVLHENCNIGDKSVLLRCVLGKNCNIGENCTIQNSYIFDNVTIGNNCVLKNSIIGSSVKIQSNCTIIDESVISNDCIISKKQTISGFLIQSKIPEQDDFSTDTFEKLNDCAYRIIEESAVQADDSEDDLDEENNWHKNYIKLLPSSPHYDSSAYSSRNESDDEEDEVEMPMDDSHVFFSEISDLLKKGIEEKANPDFLILEINSSRFANNIQLHEVNFFVVKAIFSLPIVQENDDPFEGFKQIYKNVRDIFKNYIKDNAMTDCLNALVECCEESENFKPKLMKILHFLYNDDILTEDVILQWYQDNETEWLKKSLKKFIEWLEQESESGSD